MAEICFYIIIAILSILLDSSYGTDYLLEIILSSTTASSSLLHTKVDIFSYQNCSLFVIKQLLNHCDDTDLLNNELIC